MDHRLVIIALILCSPAMSATYCVSNGGSDSNPGTATGPNCTGTVSAWRTIAHVNAAVISPGDQILFQSGSVWYEELIPATQGSSLAQITYGSYGNGPGPKPQINGSDVLASWTGSGPYYASWSEAKPAQVYYNTSRLLNVFTLGALATGDWYWDSTDSRIYIYDPPSGHTVQASDPVRSNAIYINGISYLTFQGLDIELSDGDGISVVSNTNNIILLNNTISNNGAHGVNSYSPSPYSTNNWIVEGNTMEYNQFSGEQQNGFADNWLVENNNFSYNVNAACAASYCGGFRSISTISPATPGQATNITLTRNTACYNGYGVTALSGLSTGSGLWFDTVATGNLMVFNLSCYNNDAGFLVEISTNVTVAYNIGYGNLDNLRFYNHDTNCGAYNNTLYYASEADITASGLYMGGDAGYNNNSFINNIAYGGGVPSLIADWGAQNDGVNGAGNVYTYNSFGVAGANFIAWGTSGPESLVYYSTYASWESATGNCGSTGCSNSLELNPLLVNPAVGNFYLQPSSPALGAGMYIAGISASNPPNIGALGVRITRQRLR
jgi:hypothetical protein